MLSFLLPALSRRALKWRLRWTRLHQIDLETFPPNAAPKAFRCTADLRSEKRSIVLAVEQSLNSLDLKPAGQEGHGLIFHERMGYNRLVAVILEKTDALLQLRRDTDREHTTHLFQGS